MTSWSRKTGTCSICNGRSREEINALLATGTSLLEIQRQTGVGRETVRKHRDDHVAKQVIAPDGDFATMVQKRAVQALGNNQIKVTTKDGLAAQALLDRRAEKEQDREFMLNLAQLLSGGGRGAPAALTAGEVVVEGEFAEVDSPLLAPPELRG